MIANAEPAIGPAVAGEFQFLRFDHMAHLMGFQVVGMDVPALANGLDRFADFAAVLNDGLVLGQVAHGDLVAQRDFVAQGDFAGGFALEG